MSSEKTEKNEEEKSRKEEIPVPLYFDRYVTSELRALKQQIADFKESVDRRFSEVDRRFVEFRGYVDGRFDDVDRRFDDVDRRFDGVDGRFDRMDKRFDRLERWIIGLFSPLIVGILAIIIKIFIFGK